MSTEVESARAALRSYVQSAVFGDDELDVGRLAELVVAAPAQNTLTLGEWWNVALLLAFRVKWTEGR